MTNGKPPYLVLGDLDSINDGTYGHFRKNLMHDCIPTAGTCPDFETDSNWIAPMLLSGSADKPALNTNSSDYLNNSSGGGELTELRKRSVPMLLEHDVPVAKLVEAFSVSWHRPVAEYFEMVTPNAYSVNESIEITPSTSGDWVFELDKSGSGVVLLFEFKEQIVGWPYFSVTALKEPL